LSSVIRVSLVSELNTEFLIKLLPSWSSSSGQLSALKFPPGPTERNREQR